MEDAIALAESGHLQEAVARFRTAIEHEDSKHSPEKLSKSHEMLAQVLLELDDVDAAYSEAFQAVKTDVEWPDAHITLARVLRNMGSLKDAIQEYRAAMALLQAADSTVDDDVFQELDEVQQLYSQGIAKQIGLPLHLTTAPGSGSGLGCIVWDAGLLLAEYLTQVTAGAGSQCWSGMHVLELGSGTGVVGLSAALLGATVLLTDLPEMMPLLQQNLASNQQAINQVGGWAEAAVLDWQSPPSHGNDSTDDHKVDEFVQQSLAAQGGLMVIGADLVYAEQQVALLTTLLQWLILTASNQPKLMSEVQQDNSSSNRISLQHENKEPALSGTMLKDQEIGAPYSQDTANLLDVSCTRNGELHKLLRCLFGSSLKQTDCCQNAGPFHVLLLAHKHRSDQVDALLCKALTASVGLRFMQGHKDASCSSQLVANKKHAWSDNALAASHPCAVYCLTTATLATLNVNDQDQVSHWCSHRA